MSPNVTLNYGVRWEPWFPQTAQDEAVYNFDIERMRGRHAQHGVPAGARRASTIPATTGSRATPA